MMEDSTPKNPNGLTKEGTKSPSSSTARKGISLKGWKNRRDKNGCVKFLKNCFKIVTAVNLPKKNKRPYWSAVTKLLWPQIFKAWKLENKQKALMKLKEYGEKAGQILKSTRDVLEKAKIKFNGVESSMQPLLQQFLAEHPQVGPEVDSSVIKGHALDVSEVRELKASLQRLDYELALLKPGIDAEFQKLFGCPVNMKFSMPAIQQPENDNSKKKNRSSRKQGHVALKVFFYMYTGKVLPRAWKKAEIKEKAKRDEAIKVGKKMKDISAPPEDAAKLEQIVFESTLAAFEEAKRQVNDCKCWLQHGVSSEVAVPDMDIQALRLDSFPGGSTQIGQSSMIYNLEWNDKVPWNLQNPPEHSESAQMLAPLKSLEATGNSSETDSQVAPEADGGIECWLEEISKQFPEIEEGGLLEELLEIAKGVPQTELESMNLHGSS